MIGTAECIDVATPKTVAISSGKGGVGKTFLSVHMAYRAAQHGHRVLLVDADLGLANVDVMLGITAKGSIHQVITGSAPLEEILVRDQFGFDVLPGGSGIHELTRLSHGHQRLLLDEMSLLAEEYDIVLVDTPAGIGENVLFFASSCESVLTVLTPDPTSLTDAYALIKVLSKRRGVRRFMVAVNQADEVAAQITFRRLLSVADRYLDVCLDYTGFMPPTDRVRAGIQSQKLLYAFPEDHCTKALNQLLDAVLSRPRDTQGSDRLRLFRPVTEIRLRGEV